MIGTSPAFAHAGVKGPPSGDAGLRPSVDPTRCDTHGICAELLPERIGLDPWGYPVRDADIPIELREHAQRAVDSRPRLALRLVKARQA